jgi:hypothetical protein
LGAPQCILHRACGRPPGGTVDETEPELEAVLKHACLMFN